MSDQTPLDVEAIRARLDAALAHIRECMHIGLQDAKLYDEAGRKRIGEWADFIDKEIRTALAAPEMPRPPAKDCGCTELTVCDTHADEWYRRQEEAWRGTAQERADGTETSPAGSGRGTGVLEAETSAQASTPWIPSFYGSECPHRPEWTCPEHDECRACECDCNTYVADLEEPDLTLIPGDMVVRDPEVCSGRPTMRGTRILASRIAGELAAGTSWETLREWYPSLPSLPVPSTEDSQ